MDDYISRQAAIDVLATMQGLCTSKTALVQNSKIWQQIKDLPSADVQPVRHGHWLRTGRTNAYGGFEVECSVCNDNVMITNIEYEHYCRNCGARMDERSE